MRAQDVFGTPGPSGERNQKAPAAPPAPYVSPGLQSLYTPDLSARVARASPRRSSQLTWVASNARRRLGALEAATAAVATTTAPPPPQSATDDADDDDAESPLLSDDMLLDFKRLVLASVEPATDAEAATAAVAERRGERALTRREVAMRATQLLVQRAENFSLHGATVRRAFLDADLRVPLDQHQEDAVRFMAQREASDAHGAVRGGFLCHRMRLGKTLTVLAFVLHDAQTRVARGEERFGAPTLFVVPTAVLPEVEAQFARHVGPPDTAPLLLRVARDTQALDDVTAFALCKSCDIVLLSYETLMALHQQRRQRFAPLADDETRQHHHHHPLFDVHWRRVVADEAHKFTNPSSQLFRVMCALQAPAKWFVSGTPVQNHRSEIAAALRFVGFTDGAAAAADPTRGTEFCAFMGSIVHFRTLARGADIVAQNTERVRQVAFRTAAERLLYAETERRFRERAAGHEHAPRNSDLRHTVRLRQLATSPALVEHLFVRADDARALARGDVIAVPRGIAALAFGSLLAYVTNVPPPTAPRHVAMHRRVVDFLRHVMLGAPETTPWPTTWLPPLSSKECAIFHALRTEIEPAGDKVVLWSHWAKFVERLDELMAVRAHLSGGTAKRSLKISGHVKAAHRAEVFRRMREDAQYSTLCITSQIGALGLDFTFANHGGITDPWFNPYAEDQMLSRLAGRAQRKPLHLFRLICSGTIDEHVRAIAQPKRLLENVVRARRDRAPAPGADAMDVEADTDDDVETAGMLTLFAPVQSVSLASIVAQIGSDVRLPVRPGGGGGNDNDYGDSAADDPDIAEAAHTRALFSSLLGV